MNFFNNKIYEKFTYGITFEEVLMIPQYTEIKSRSECSIETRFSKKIEMKTPFISSPMDTVTEYKMAIEMARNGGLGIIHRFLSIEEQCEMVRKVKRAEKFIIEDAYLIDQNDSISTLKNKMAQFGVSTFLVTDLEKIGKNHNFNNTKRKGSLWKSDNYELKGIITNRDLLFAKSSKSLIKDIMTPMEKLVYFKKESGNNPTIDDLYSLLIDNRLEKLPIVNEYNQIVGLSCIKDLQKINNSLSLANKDLNNNLIVGAAIGIKDDYQVRADELIQSGANTLTIDVANGHNSETIKTLFDLKSIFPKTEFLAGNVASGEGARKLIEAGADSIRVGIGNGSICITRIVSGSGVPQFSALLNIMQELKDDYNVPIVSDGGNKNSGNMCKALAAGADCIMMGRLLAGTDEAPGEPFLNEGKLVKIHRGMAGFGANLSKAQRMGQEGAKQPDSLKFSAEGVEGFVNYCGSLSTVLNKFSMGIKSGMSYVGARSISELRDKVKFMIISPASITESNVHGIKKI